jgi:hypothetical protein
VLHCHPSSVPECKGTVRGIGSLLLILKGGQMWSKSLLLWFEGPLGHFVCLFKELFLKIFAEISIIS